MFAVPATRASTRTDMPGDSQRRAPSPRRRHLGRRLLALLCLPWVAVAAEQAPVVAHVIEARIDPDAGRLVATDRLTLPPDIHQAVFLLHQGLSPKVADGDAVLERVGRDGHLERFRLTLKSGDTLTLSYGGVIQHPLERLSEGMGRSREQLIGSIGSEGVFLSGYTGWYPNIPGALNRMALDVTLPAGWLAVSQGAGPQPLEGKDTTMRWVEEQPQDALYLSAARYKLYRKPTPHGEAQAYLRLPDDELAERYLDATADYLARYSDLIGPYPYAKFALVENFWETGYGMPSFTLLGSRVLRLPFILHSSYPHEILHNWWGNSVYVDYASGNWAEGLTAYLADHLNQAQAGRGADYRRDQLKAYADYAQRGEDFPLTEFTARHGSASQAVGYGKMLMTMHMLRVMLGDDTFRSGLRTFYRQNRFSTADLDDLQFAFELASNRDLDAFFDAWTTRTGAPELKLGDVHVEQAEGGYRLHGSLYQTQEAPPWPMTVPVVVHSERGTARRVLAEFNGRGARFEARLASTPVRVAVDPQFDSFRTLMPEEAPPTLSALFGAGRGLMVLPAGAPAAELAAYRRLAEDWGQGADGWRVVTDAELDALPAAGAVWLFGWDNAFAERLGDARPGLDLDTAARSVTLDGTAHDAVSLALAGGTPDRVLGWVAAGTPAAISGLARKLPHYGKYSYLTFTGDAPDNSLKGQWPAGDSALTLWLSDERPALRAPTQSPLTAR